MTDFRTRLTQPGILVADGATGTMMQKLGLPPGVAPERWNLENPDRVRALHRSYIDAGADVILTNTFGGTRFRLEREKLGDQVVAVNSAAAHLATEEAKAAPKEVFVLGDIGPSGKLIKPLGPLTYVEAVEAFAEQATGLLEGGVDAILVETMSDLNEARAAVEGVRQVMENKGNQLPVFVTMSFDTHGRTMMGVKPDQAAQVLSGLQVDAIGANCGRTLSETLDAIGAMRQALPHAILIAKPNAGLPRREIEKGKNTAAVYDVSPEVMAEWAGKFAALDVKIFGGCCGSTPEHIREITQVLNRRDP